LIKEKYVDVKGIRTRYLEAGKGQPLLLVHGGSFGTDSSADSWDTMVDAFAEFFHVFAIDKIGQGFTDNPKRDDEYVIGTAVQHAYDFLNIMGIESAHLMGHSRGGYAVTRLALEHPEKAKVLIIVDSSTLMTPPNPLYDEWAKQAAQIKDIRERERYLVSVNSFKSDHITEKLLDAKVKIVSQPKIQEAKAKMDAGLNKRFKEDLVAKQKETHEWIKAGGLKTPTLIMWGFNDPSATIDRCGIPAMKLILSSVPKSEMHVLNEAGHSCYREQPKAFVTVVTNFIKLNS
jgi:pimeloyl-ACP methyl ester carboxylesterase